MTEETNDENLDDENLDNDGSSDEIEGIDVSELSDEELQDYKAELERDIAEATEAHKIVMNEITQRIVPDKTASLADCVKGMIQRGNAENRIKREATAAATKAVAKVIGKKVA